MKITLLLAATLIIASNSYSQKINSEKVTFKSKRLPMEPLNSEVEGYLFTVKTPYSSSNDELIANAQRSHEEAVANFPETIKQSKIDHENAMAEYDQEVETARENFELESKEYNALSKIERLALKDQKPTLKTPRKPVYRAPREPVYRAPSTSNIIVYDPEVLAGSYMKLEGYSKKESGNILQGNVVLNDFEHKNPERKFTEKSVYNSSTKTSTKQKVYYYITEYKRPVYVKVYIGGSTLFEGMIESTSEYTELKSTNSPNLQNLEKQTVEDGMNIANDFINDKYGFSQIEHTYIVSFAKNKGGDYDDMEEAKDIAVSAYKDFKGGKNAEELSKAIAIWEEMLTKSDVNNKKARVNEKITMNVLSNLIDAYLVSERPEEASKHMKSYNDFKLKYAEKTNAAAQEDRITDLKKRVEANR